MQTTEKDITAHIARVKKKAILFTEDFRGYGTPEAVKTALHRLVNKGVLKRMARGVYVKPAYSSLLQKEILPGVEEIANEIAKRDKARVIPSGSYALNVLGLSTQVPLKIVYLTDGSPRKITIGNTEVKFKRVAPKKLAYKGQLSTLVVQALSAIGRNQVTEEQKSKIIDLLQKENYKNLKHDIGIAPLWMAEIMARAL